MRRLVGPWPRTSAGLAERYLRTGPVRGRGRGWQPPYWLRLPAWLFARATPAARRRAGRGFLGDVLWAQYCLFLYVRIQDDVLDGQVGSARLLFVADEFLLESERVLGRHLRDEPFRAFYRASLAGTARAILEVEALQRAGGMTRGRLEAYARVPSIFQVGAAAVCEACRWPDAAAAARRFGDEMAIGSQLLDDLEDLEEDLEAGRVNAVARWLLGRDTRRGGLRARVAAAAFTTDRLDQLLVYVSARFARARDALAPLELPQAPRYFDQVERDLARLRQSIHRARVEATFAPAMARRPARRPPGRTSPRASA